MAFRDRGGCSHSRRLTTVSCPHRVEGEGTLLGLFLAVGFLLQTQGLQDTLAGVSGSLTGVSILLTPVAAALLFDERIGRRGWAAVLVGTVGLAMLAGGVTAGSLLGATLAVGGAVAVAGHVAGLAMGHERERSRAHRLERDGGAAVTCAGVAWVTGGVGLAAQRFRLGGRGLPFRARGVPAWDSRCQAWPRVALTAANAAVMMTMEPVSAAVVAALMGERGLTPLAWSGGLLVVASMLLADLGPRRCCGGLRPNRVLLRSAAFHREWGSACRRARRGRTRERRPCCVSFSVVARAFNSITWAWRSRK